MKNLKLNTAMLSLTLGFFSASCAGPESYQQKMARYTPKEGTRNQVPEFKMAEFKFEKPEAKGSRTPASAPEKDTVEKEQREANPTNKKLYFLTLYSQYQTLQNYAQDFVGPTVSICPNFHTSLLKHKEKTASSWPTEHKTKDFSYEMAKLTDDMYVSTRPELLLPLSKDEATPRVIDVIKSSGLSGNDFAINELVHKAIDIHLAKTYAEIRELCEYGVSDNYYIYENLITHIKNNKFEADSKNLNTLLKTTVFSNYALMTSLEAEKKEAKTGRGLASVASEGKKGSYTSEIMARLNVSWASQYFDYIRASH